MYFNNITDAEIEHVLSHLTEVQTPARTDRRDDPLAGSTRRAPGATRVLAALCRPGALASRGVR